MEDYSKVSDKDLQQLIGRFLLDQVPNDDWSRVQLEVEMNAEDAGRFVAGYWLKSKPETRMNLRASRLHDAFVELRRRTQKPGFAPWKAARLVITPPGRFKLDFTYPDR